MSMLKELTQVHLRAVRWPLVPLVLLCLGLPMWIMRMIQVVPPALAKAGHGFPRDVLQMQESFTVIFPVLACIVGATVALSAWSWDHQTRHVYALSLPITRARYALLKMMGGMGVLLIPIIALSIGTFVGIALTNVPEGLHAYPFAFILRFTLGTLIIYSAIFALASTSVRTTTLVLVSFIGVFVFGSIIAGMVAQVTRNPNVISPAQIVGDALVNWPGPFNVFGGSWLILDA